MFRENIQKECIPAQIRNLVRGKRTIRLSQARKHPGSYIGGVGAGYGDLVGVDGGCGVGIGVAQLGGSGDQIDTVGDQGGGCRVSEGVRVQMGDAHAVTEITHPLGDAVRVQGGAVVPDKYIGCVLPAVAVFYLQTVIFNPPLLQNRQTLGRQLQGPDVSCFGLTFIGALGLGIEQRPINDDNAGFKIDLFPFETGNLAASAAGVDEQIGNRLPADGSFLQCPQNLLHLAVLIRLITGQDKLRVFKL